MWFFESINDTTRRLKLLSKKLSDYNTLAVSFLCMAPRGEGGKPTNIINLKGAVMLTKLQNQPLKSIKRKRFKSCMIPVSNSFVGMIYGSKSLQAPAAPLGLKKVLTGVIGNSGRACFSILALLFTSFTLCNVTFAESVSISVSSASQSFDLIPGASVAFGKSGDITASITTDYAYGYDFTVSGPDDDQQLKSATSHLSSISSSAAEETFRTSTDVLYNNKWAFLPSKLNSESNTNCQPGPLNTTPTQIDITTTANPDTANTYTFAIAARIDNTAAKETYSTTFTLAAVANTMNYSIGFVDLTNNMPATISGNTDQASVTLPTNRPLKEGHVFQGWCSAPTTTEVCGGTTYQPGTTYDLENGAITNLYAIWKEGMYMQDITDDWKDNIVSTDPDNPTTLYDARDGKAYQVAKLADGNIWMLDNLAFVPLNNSTLTPADTNIETDTEVTDWRWVPGSSYVSPLISSAALMPAVLPTTGDTKNGLDAATTVNWKYGAYYNYAAASAGKYIYPAGEGVGNADEDICPKGWKLPGHPRDSFGSLYAIYGNNTKTMREKLHLPLSGFILSYGNGLIGNQGDSGHFWTSVYNGTERMFDAFINGITGNVNFGSSSSTRDLSIAVRCIVK